MKNLILTDPHRIKCTAESIPVKFHVPVGCQLITIYIPQNEYDELVKNSERIQTMCMNQENVNANGGSGGLANGSIVNGINAYPPIQFKKKIMKRDKSLVFTNIPEEHLEQSDVGASMSSSTAATAGAAVSNASAPDQVDVGNGGDEKLTSEQRNNENPLKFTPQPATARPNHLPLRFKNITSKDIPESGFSSSITFDEQDSFPQFIGRTSVCSTPMTENKVLHGNILPICGNPYNEKNANAATATATVDETVEVSPTNNSSTAAADVVAIQQQPTITNNQVSMREPKQTNCQLEVNQKDNGKIFDLPDRIVNRSIAPPTQSTVRRNSLIDIAEAFRKFSKHLSLRPISNGFANFMHECDYIADGKIYPYGKLADDSMTIGGGDDSVIDFDADEIDDVVANNRYRTIADPTYPVFNSFGKPISHSLYDEIMNQQNQLDSVAKNFEKSHFNAFDEPPAPPPPPASQTMIHNDLKSADTDDKVEKAIKSLEKPQLAQPNNNINRKSLSLPLKSLTSSNEAKTNNNANINSATTSTAAAAASAATAANTVIPTDIINTKNIFDRPDERRKLNGIQLTPLITKLSILAMSEERSNAFSSWDITPGIESATPLDSVKMFRRRSSVRADETDQVQSASNKRSSDGSDDLELRKVELFICGQNNMTMLLIMSENHSQKQEHIQAMV